MEGSNQRRGWPSWAGKAALAAFGMAYPNQGGAYDAPGQGGGPGRHGGRRGDGDESRSQRPDPRPTLGTGVRGGTAGRGTA